MIKRGSKISVLLVAIVTTIFLLPSCKKQESSFRAGLFGQKQDQPSSTVRDFISAAKDTIRMLGHWKGEGGRERYIRELIQEFNFLNQDLHVTLTFPEDDPEVMAFFNPAQRHEERALFIADMIRKKKIKYDIVPMMGNIYNMVGQALGEADWGPDHLVDFSKAPGFIDTQKPFVFSDPIYRRNTRGMVVGPFVEGSYYLFYYNRELAEKIGLKINEAGMRFDEMLKYVDRIQDYNRTHGANIAPIYESGDWTTMTILFEHLFKSEIGFSESYRIPSTFTPRNREALLKTLKAIETLQKKKAFPSSGSEIIWSETLDFPLEDKVFFYVNGTWMFNIWEVIDPEKAKKMIPAELPVFSPCDYYPGLYIMDFAVMKESRKAEKAIRFMMRWCTKDASNDWTRYAKSPSGIAGHIDASGIGGDVYERFTYRLDQKYGTRISFLDTDLDYIFGRNYSLPTNFFTEKLREVIQGRKTADEVNQEILARFR